jgi:NDP-sugar pyrophosphorylase family protein
VRGMILAAGLGTRLRPLTYEVPKPVVPVLGRPLCSYNMEFLARAGVTAFILNIHHRPGIVRQRVSMWAGGRISVEYAVEPVILGTGGGIRNAREFLSGRTFITANGDTIVRFPLAAAAAFHRARKALSTLVLFPDPERIYTPVWIDDGGRVTGFGTDAGGGRRSGFYTGFQIVEPEILEAIPPGRPSCIVRETYAPLAAKGAPVFGFLTSGSFREFGSPADYLEGTLALLAEKTADGALPPPAAAGAVVRPPVFVSRGAAVAAGAAIGPEAVIEEGASVGAGASVSRTVLWPGARIGESEAVRGAIVTPSRRVFVPEGAAQPVPNRPR